MDIPYAFIYTCIGDDKDMAIINIRGVLVDIIMDIATDVYGPYVITDFKGINQIIV